MRSISSQSSRYSVHFGVIAAALGLAAASCGEGVDDPRPPAPAGGSAADAPPIDPGWLSLPPMNIARGRHGATLLSDGRVLMTGGTKYVTEDSSLKETEIFDPNGETWRVLLPMLARRQSHTATRLLDDSVLVAGGGSYPLPVVGTERCDKAAGPFSSSDAMSSDRVAPTATLLHDGRVLVVGGAGNDPQGAELFDPATNTWSKTGSMAHPRYRHTATLLDDGRVLIVGGLDPSGDEQSSAELYSNGQFIETSTMIGGGRSEHTATKLRDGRVLITGGRGSSKLGSILNATLVFAPDESGGAWSQGITLRVRRALHTATLLSNGWVLIAGGVDESLSAVASAELIDPDAETVVSDSPMSSVMRRTHAGHSATLLMDGATLIAGGVAQASAELFRQGEIGASCQAGGECLSGFCADGVCCNAKCDGDCYSCALEGSRGQCTQVPKDTDPRHRCGGPCVACTASAKCELRPQGAVCASECDGASGRLIQVCTGDTQECPAAAPKQATCGAFRCDESTGECLQRCRSVNDCAQNLACDRSGQCVRRPDVSSDEVTCEGSAARLEGSRSALLVGLAAAGFLWARRRLRGGPSAGQARKDGLTQ